MLIHAKFASTCGVCRKPIARGERIDWERGRAARHATCTGQTAGESRARRQVADDQAAWNSSRGQSMRDTPTDELRTILDRARLELVTSDRIGDGWAGWMADRIKGMQAELDRREEADNAGHAPDLDLMLGY